MLFVAICGQLRCYHPESLRLIWKNSLKGLGYATGKLKIDLFIFPPKK